MHREIRRLSLAVVSTLIIIIATLVALRIADVIIGA